MLRAGKLLALLIAAGLLTQPVPLSKPDGPWSVSAEVREPLRYHGERIRSYAHAYSIPADLAELVYQEAARSGVEPSVAFALVHTESRFQQDAVSDANALGLAQVRLETARTVRPSVTRAQLLSEPRTNLRIGFRYFQRLMDRYGRLRLALLAYNRGPTQVSRDLAQRRDPSNGYAHQVTRHLR